MRSMRLRKITGLLLVVVIAISMVSCIGGGQTRLDSSRDSYRVEDIPNVQRQDARRFVSNPDGILSEDAVKQIDSMCYSLKEQGLAEVAVVAVNDIEPQDMFSFSQNLATSWGIGDEKLDNGLLILFVRDMREIRFHTGYGLEGVLPDATCVQIQQDYMLPSFENEEYSKGMVKGMKAVNSLLTSGELPVAEAEEDTAAMITALIITIFIVVVPLVAVYISNRKQKRCPSCGKYKLRVTDRSIVEKTATHITIHETLVCDNCKTIHTRTTRQNRGGGGGIMFIPMGFGGGRGGGFGGGGFGGGGFGGGSFGGGGGGSRW